MRGKPKQLPCKKCGEIVKNVGSQATHVTCWKCVNEMMKHGFNDVEPEEKVRPIAVNIKITKTKNKKDD